MRRGGRFWAAATPVRRRGSASGCAGTYQHASRYSSKDPMHGCQTGTECPILHAKYDRQVPINFSDARLRCKGAWAELRCRCTPQRAEFTRQAPQLVAATQAQRCKLREVPDFWWQRLHGAVTCQRLHEAFTSQCLHEALLMSPSACGIYVSCHVSPAAPGCRHGFKAQ
jgi:hypothetical protein